MSMQMKRLAVGVFFSVVVSAKPMDYEEAYNRLRGRYLANSKVRNALDNTAKYLVRQISNPAQVEPLGKPQFGDVMFTSIDGRTIGYSRSTANSSAIDRMNWNRAAATLATRLLLDPDAGLQYSSLGIDADVGKRYTPEEAFARLELLGLGHLLNTGIQFQRLDEYNSLAPTFPLLEWAQKVDAAAGLADALPDAHVILLDDREGEEDSRTVYESQQAEPNSSWGHVIVDGADFGITRVHEINENEVQELVPAFQVAATNEPNLSATRKQQLEEIRLQDWKSAAEHRQEQLALMLSEDAIEAEGARQKVLDLYRWQNNLDRNAELTPEQEADAFIHSDVRALRSFKAHPEFDEHALETPTLFHGTAWENLDAEKGWAGVTRLLAMDPTDPDLHPAAQMLLEKAAARAAQRNTAVAKPDFNYPVVERIDSVSVAPDAATRRKAGSVAEELKREFAAQGKTVSIINLADNRPTPEEAVKIVSKEIGEVRAPNFGEGSRQDRRDAIEAAAERRRQLNADDLYVLEHYKSDSKAISELELLEEVVHGYEDDSFDDLDLELCYAKFPELRPTEPNKRTLNAPKGAVGQLANAWKNASQHDKRASNRRAYHRKGLIIPVTIDRQIAALENLELAASGGD